MPHRTWLGGGRERGRLCGLFGVEIRWIAGLRILRVVQRGAERGLGMCGRGILCRSYGFCLGLRGFLGRE